MCFQCCRKKSSINSDSDEEVIRYGNTNNNNFQNINDNSIKNLNKSFDLPLGSIPIGTVADQPNQPTKTDKENTMTSTNAKSFSEFSSNIGHPIRSLRRIPSGGQPLYHLGKDDEKENEKEEKDSTNGSFQNLDLNLDLNFDALTSKKINDGQASVEKGHDNPGFVEEEPQIRLISNSPPPFKMPEQSSEDVIESQEIFEEFKPISLKQKTESQTSKKNSFIYSISHKRSNSRSSQSKISAEKMIKKDFEQPAAGISLDKKTVSMPVGRNFDQMREQIAHLPEQKNKVIFESDYSIRSMANSEMMANVVDRTVRSNVHNNRDSLKVNSSQVTNPVLGINSSFLNIEPTIRENPNKQNSQISVGYPYNRYLFKRSNSNASSNKSFSGVLENLRTQSKVAEDFTSELMLELDQAFGQESVNNSQISQHNFNDISLDYSLLGNDNDDDNINKRNKKEEIYDVIQIKSGQENSQSNDDHQNNSSIRTKEQRNSIISIRSITTEKDTETKNNTAEKSSARSYSHATLIKSFDYSISYDKSKEQKPAKESKNKANKKITNNVLKSQFDEQIKIKQMNDYDLQIDTADSKDENIYAAPNRTFNPKIDNQILADDPPIELHSFSKTSKKSSMVNGHVSSHKNDTILVSDPEVITKSSVSRKFSFISKSKLEYKDDFYGRPSSIRQLKRNVQNASATNNSNKNDQNLDSGIPSSNNTTPVNTLQPKIPVHSFREKISREVSIRSNIPSAKEGGEEDDDKIYENIPQLPNDTLDASKKNKNSSGSSDYHIMVRNISNPARPNSEAFSVSYQPSVISMNETSEINLNRTQSSDQQIGNRKIRIGSESMSMRGSVYSHGQVSNGSIRTMPNSIIKRSIKIPNREPINVISMIEDDSFELVHKNAKANDEVMRKSENKLENHKKIDKKFKKYSKSMNNSKKMNASSRWSLRSSSKNKKVDKNYDNENPYRAVSEATFELGRVSKSKVARPLMNNELTRRSDRPKIPRPASVHLGI